MRTVTTTELIEEAIREHWDLIDSGCSNTWFPVQLMAIILCKITERGDVTVLADRADVHDYAGAIDEVRALIDREQRKAKRKRA